MEDNRYLDILYSDRVTCFTTTGNPRPAPPGESMNRPLVLTAALTLLLPPLPLLAQTKTAGTIISTGDGDTLRVQVNRKPITVR